MPHDLASQVPRGGYAADSRPEAPRVFVSGTEPATVKTASLDVANPNLSLPEPHGP
jgi:hypothetical protein